MTYSGVLLYGPPASGKSTVTAVLSGLDERFTLFERLRVSAVPKSGYRNVTVAEANSLAAQGQILYENERYGNRYIVDRAEIERLNSMARIPILHLGQIDGIRAVQVIGPWLTVSLFAAGRQL
ncbi:hypothetical protein [Actinospica robiniae]|uniref:hypothetical protein n=1 Tax=Actinospica robiniae TaxID=304901 RepID=UPI00040F8B41|nr:hypothetical protein [Actinospica robiniae]